MAGAMLAGMDWNLPRCSATELEWGFRCQQVPDHQNAHAVVWRLPKGPVQLRRWRDGEPATDTGRDPFGDLVAAEEMRWAIGLPAPEVVG